MIIKFRSKALSIKIASIFAASTCLVFTLASCSTQDTSKDEAAANETTSQPEKIRIAAAANLSDVLPKIVEAYNAENNLTAQDIELTFASSGKLYAQMIAGAPYDIYLSANQDFPARWVSERVEDAAQTKPFTYTQGQLAFYSTTNNVHKPVGTLNETTLTALLAEQSEAKITIANPDLAPYGASARAYLQTQNIYDLLNTQKRIIQAENIGQAFQYANTGSVDYGFVAQSQVTAIKATPEQFYTLPVESYPAILQDGIVLSDAALATDFTRYLLSPAGQQYFADAGYLAVK